MTRTRSRWLGVGGVSLLTTFIATATYAQAPPQGAAAPGQGGRGGPPAPPQNLQILSKDIPRPELLATMRGFTAGLGVQCNYCHIQEGQGGRNDMASDEKAPKKTARVMMRMMASVNETLAGNLGKTAADITKVECVTCHRAEAIPKNPPPPPPPTPPGAAGAPPGR